MLSPEGYVDALRCPQQFAIDQRSQGVGKWPEADQR